jgi:hypothetical protein
MIDCFRNDLDDKNNVNLQWSDKDIVEYIDRSIKYINDQIRMAKKYVYYTFNATKNMYAIPSNYTASAKQLIDYRNQRVIAESPYTMDRSPYTTRYVNDDAWQYWIDENRKKLILDYIPDASKDLTYPINKSNLTSATNPMYYQVVAEDINYDFDEWFNPTIAITSNTKQWALPTQARIYNRVTAVKDAYWIAEYVSTSNVSNYTTSTLAIADADLYFNIGDEVFVDGEILTVSNTSSTTLTFSSNFIYLHTIASPLTYFIYNLSTPKAGTITNHKICYISDANIEVSTAISESYMKPCDFALEYFYQPTVNIAQGIVTSSGANSYATTVLNGSVYTTVNFTSGSNQPAVGDYLYILESQTARKVIAVGTNTCTIDSAFSSNVTTSVVYWVIDGDAIPPFPLETHSVIIEMTKYYANQSIGNPSTDIKQFIDTQLQQMKYVQLQDAVNSVYSQRRSKKFDEDYRLDTYMTLRRW